MIFLKSFKKFILSLFAGILFLILSFYTTNIYILSVLSAMGMFPLFVDIYKKMKNRKISLRLPLVITIIILMYLGNYTVASFFLILILLGSVFKNYILLRVEDSINSISKEMPHTAYILVGGVEKEVDIQDVSIGDICVVRAGSRVPVNGKLLSAQVYFDESVVTGESVPVKKNTGDLVISGSILVSGYSEIEATATAGESTVAQIEKLVRNAQHEQAKLSSFTTRYASYTILFTIIAMVVFYLFKKNVLQTLALWVALVPIIFSIIVPIATTIGISILARYGILVRKARSLEDLTKITMVVFDKTGTLTEGKTQVHGIISYDSSLSEDKILQKIASVEKQSEHPFARAVVRYAQKKNISFSPVSSFATHKGKGVSGVVDGEEIIIGDIDFMKELHFNIGDNVISDILSLENEAKSVFIIAYNKKIVAIISISDAIRVGAHEVILSLKDQNIKTIILTGDNKVVASKIAKQLSIDKFYANLSPDDKNILIEKFKDDGHKILMLGDGINDAPALANADVGLAMGGGGIDLTMKAADIVLINNDISKIPFLIKSSKKVFSIIKLDLWVATIIHIITAVLVVGGVVGVLGSTLLHQVSSVFVLVNTMRVFRIKQKIK